MKEYIKFFTMLICMLAVCKTSFAKTKNQDRDTFTFTDSFTDHANNRFSIRVKKSYVSIALGKNSGEKIEYSVFKNGKFLFPEYWYHTGSMLGCRLNESTSIEEDNPIQRIVINNVNHGWWLKLWNSCGSRSTKRYTAIFPALESADTYSHETIVSHFQGVYANKPEDGKGFQLWHFQYIKDCGAYSVSALHRKTIATNPRSLTKEKNNWPKLSDFPYFESQDPKTRIDQSTYPSDYESMFATGVLNNSVDLIKESAKLFDELALPKQQECPLDFIPRTKGDLEKVIAALETLEAQRLFPNPLFKN